MKEQRRRMPKVVSPLEMLDDRIVPSAIHASAIHAQHHHARMHAAHEVSRAAMVMRLPAATPTESSASVPASPSTPTSTSVSSLRAFSPSSPSPAVVITPTVTPSMTDIKSGPLAKAGQALIAIYQAYQQGGAASLTSTGPGSVMIQGTNVGIDAHMASGSFSNYVSSLASLGMQIKLQDPGTGIVEGLIPINQLVAAAQNPQTLSLSPIYNKLPR